MSRKPSMQVLISRLWNKDMINCVIRELNEEILTTFLDSLIYSEEEKCSKLTFDQRSRGTAGTGTIWIGNRRKRVGRDRNLEKFT